MPQYDKTVLIVDDSPEILECLRSKMASWPVHIFEASSAVEALGYIVQGLEVDLIVCDIHMPILNGIEFAEILKSRKSLTPLILMSGETSYATLDNTKLGHAGFLPKPLDMRKFEQLVKAALKADSECLLEPRASNARLG